MAFLPFPLKPEEQKKKEGFFFLLVLFPFLFPPQPSLIHFLPCVFPFYLSCYSLIADTAAQKRISGGV